MKVINYIWGILAMLAISSCGGGNENATPYKDEQYCNKVVAIAKKVKAGDDYAMTQYASALESAEELQKILDNPKNDMTAPPPPRPSKIAAK